MAKTAGRSHALTWLIVGIVAGVLATIAIYLFMTRPPTPPAPVVPGESVRMETPPLPPEPAPPPVAAPEIAPPTPAPRASVEPDAQVNEDAAATGMTGPATRDPEPDTAVNPTN